jgi:hypothetical protein
MAIGICPDVPTRGLCGTCSAAVQSPNGQQRPKKRLYLTRAMFADWVACSLLAATVVVSGSLPARGQQAGLEGSWSGSGRVALPSGTTERARCRATFRRQSGNTFGMSAQCATASVRVAQTAALERVGANRFTGNFYNAEYAVSGTITIMVNGNRLNASLSGGGGSASFALSR